MPTAETVRAAWREEAEHGHLFLFVPVLLGAGASLWFALDDPPSVFVIAIAATAMLLLAGTWRGGAGAAVAWGCAFVLCGPLLAEGEIRRDTAVLLDTPVTTRLTGVVEEREVGPAGDWRYIVSVAATAEPRLKRPPLMVSLTARSGHQPFSIGQTVTGRARLSPPSGPALPGTFDFAFSAYFRGIGAVGYFVGPPERPPESAAAEETGWRLAASRWLQALRTGATDRIRDVIGGDSGAFAAAIVTGERRGMSEETVEALRISGLAHIISISGLHMALAAGLFFVGMRLILSLSVGLNHAVPVKKVAAFGALLAATAYLLISGGQVSAVRAYVMTAVMLVAVLLDRPAISLRNLALAAFVIVVVEPSEVVGPSFQMSFAATAGLIAGYAAWRDSRPADGFLPRGLLPKPARYLLALFGGILLSSLIGGLSTAAFAVDFFHRFGVYSMPANLAAMPVVSFIVMPMALVAMILMPFGLDYVPLVLLGFGLDIVIMLAREVASWGGDGGVERLPEWFLPCFVAGFVMLTLLRTRLRHVGTAIIAVTIGAAVLLPSPRAGALLVSEDGMLVGLASEGAIATNRTRPPGFVFSQWQEALLRPRHIAPLDRPQPEIVAEFKAAREARLTPDNLLARARGLMRETAADLPPDRFSCAGRLFCLARLGKDMTVATVEETALVGAACDMADLVVTPRRPGFRECRSGARLISAEDLRLTGALELWPEEGGERRFRVRHALGGALRPWHLHRRYDWRSDDYDRTPAEDVVKRISGSGG